MRTTLTLALFLLASSGLAAAPGNSPTLQGVWSYVAQQRDCSTEAPIGPPIRGLLTYERDGSLTESNGALAFQPGQRSIGHGTWSRPGRRYADRSVLLILFDTAPGTPPGSPGFQAGWQLIERSIRLTSNNTFSANGTSTFLDLSGDVYRTACASVLGERLQ
jgi:hypothetical protein